MAVFIDNPSFQIDTSGWGHQQWDRRDVYSSPKLTGPELARAHVLLLRDAARAPESAVPVCEVALTAPLPHLRLMRTRGHIGRVRRHYRRRRVGGRVAVRGATVYARAQRGGAAR